VDGAQRTYDVLPGNNGRGATRVPAHCRGATTIHVSSCAQHHPKAPNVFGTTAFYHLTPWYKSHDGNF